jgi:hypothetical protein
MPPAEFSETTETGLTQSPDATDRVESDDRRPSTGVHDGVGGEAEVVSRPDTRHHWLLLIGAVIVVALSAALNVRPEGQVGLPGVQRPLPGVCSFRRMTGHPCPGCGLTRSFISIAHGDLRAAWDFNPSGILLFGLLASQIPYRAMQIWRIRTGRDELRWTGVAFYLTWIVVIAMVGQWTVRLLMSLFT